MKNTTTSNPDINQSERIRIHIQRKKNNARDKGLKSIIISSKELAEELNNIDPDVNYMERRPSVCNAMRDLMDNPRDKILHTPPKGNGSTLKIEYFLV